MTKPKQEIPERVVLPLTADWHCGSSLGLMVNKPFHPTDEITVEPSPAQKIIWKQFKENALEIAKEREKSQLIIIFNGDPVEGIHHETTQLMSGRVDVHEKIHIECMSKFTTMTGYEPANGDKAYYISGTEEHGGNGSQSDERVAKDLDGVVPQWSKMEYDDDGEPYLNGKFTWNRLLLNVKGNLLDIAHHGGSVGRRAWTTSDGLRNIIKSIYFECLENNLPIPRYWIRAHLHQFVHAYYEGSRGIIEGIILPSFQLKTGFVYKVFGMTTKPSDIGMVTLIIEPDGSSHWTKNIMTFSQDEVQEA